MTIVDKANQVVNHLLNEGVFGVQLWVKGDNVIFCPHSHQEELDFLEDDWEEGEGTIELAAQKGWSMVKILKGGVWIDPGFPRNVKEVKDILAEHQIDVTSTRMNKTEIPGISVPEVELDIESSQDQIDSIRDRYS